MPLLKSNISRMVAVAVIAAGTGLGSGLAIAGQPNMDGALASLQSAQNYLNQVTENKAGHAAKARELVAEAIVQVQEGIAYGQSKGE